MVDPLPFVPVMWIDLKLLYGLSSNVISFLNISVSRVTVLPGILAFFRIYKALESIGLKIYNFINKNLIIYFINRNIIIKLLNKIVYIIYTHFLFIP